ncbi:ATP-binding protein [Streptomyces sp. NPDC002588]|uniref:ATP-binding protein n=1 Tax=Streptomyces sp. NPDC002588 TaxID=3154419 RepID=UPI00331A8F32
MIREFPQLRLSPTPRGARLARLLATEQLRSWGVPLDPAAHIVAELANNAVTHGRVPGRDFALDLYVIADTLRIEVTDTRGDRLPCLRPAGRGLLLVDALADRWGVFEGLRPRKTVWAEVRLSPEPENQGFGAGGGHSKTKTRVKGPHQAPPLPPAERSHPGG